MTDATEATHGSEHEDRDGPSGSLPSLPMSPLSIAPPSGSGLMSKAAEAVQHSEGEDSDETSGSLPRRPSSPLLDIPSDRSAASLGESYEADDDSDSLPPRPDEQDNYSDSSGSLPRRPDEEDDHSDSSGSLPHRPDEEDDHSDSSGSLPRRPDEEDNHSDSSGSLPRRPDEEDDHADSSGSLPPRPSSSPEGASADSDLPTTTPKGSEPIDCTEAPLLVPSAGNQLTDNSLGKQSPLNSRETRSHSSPPPPPIPNLLPEFLDSLQAAVHGSRLKSADVQESIRKFTNRHVREAHYNLASHDPQIIYNPSVRQIKSTPSEPSARSHVMHEDALRSLDTQLILHPWSTSVAYLELLGAAHAEETKHISFMHEIFESHSSTKISLHSALDSIDDLLNSPPFIK